MLETTNILTERLELRAIDPEVMDTLFQNKSNDYIMTFLRLQDEIEFDKQKKKWKTGLRTNNKSFLYFQLLDVTTKKIIGWCGYHTWYLDHYRAEIGYGLYEEKYKEKGLMTEALLPILAYGWREMKLHRIEAFVSPNNIPSLKLLERFGFQQEGLLKEHYLKSGVFEDSLVFSLLNKKADIK